MSYQDLWESFEEVKKFWLENKQIAEAYLELVRFKHSMGRKNMEFFEKLQNFAFFKLARGSLLPVCEKLKTFYSEQALAYKTFTEGLNMSVIQSLEGILQSQEQKFKETSEICRSLERQKKKLKKTLESSKEKYWKSCRETLLSNKSKPECITKEAQCLEAYIKNIDSLNLFSLKFAEDMSKNLDLFQIMEAERLEVLSESLKNTHDLLSRAVKSLIPSLESTAPIINSINLAQDIREFISSNKKSEVVTLNFIDPSPYGVTCTVPKQKKSEEDQLFQRILIKCWEGLLVLSSEIEHFSLLVQLKEHRKSWLYFMNERRIKSQFFVHPVGFDLMEKLIEILLNHIQKDLDEYSAKMAIVMSQTFFTLKHNEKYYLHNDLSHHPIWTSQEIWGLMIEEGIKQEMSNYLQFCTDDTSEEHRSQVSSLMISQLSSYIHIMKTFGISTDFIISVSNSLKEKFQITDLDVSDFLEN